MDLDDDRLGALTRTAAGHHARGEDRGGARRAGPEARRRQHAMGSLEA
jgi:hypothetical protein